MTHFTRWGYYGARTKATVYIFLLRCATDSRLEVLLRSPGGAGGGDLWNVPKRTLVCSENCVLVYVGVFHKLPPPYPKTLQPPCLPTLPPLGVLLRFFPSLVKLMNLVFYPYSRETPVSNIILIQISPSPVFIWKVFLSKLDVRPHREAVHHHRTMRREEGRGPGRDPEKTSTLSIKINSDLVRNPNLSLSFSPPPPPKIFPPVGF